MFLSFWRLSVCMFIVNIGNGNVLEKSVWKEGLVSMNFMLGHAVCRISLGNVCLWFAFRGWQQSLKKILPVLNLEIMSPRGRTQGEKSRSDLNVSYANRYYFIVIFSKHMSMLLLFLVSLFYSVQIIVPKLW